MQVPTEAVLARVFLGEADRAPVGRLADGGRDRGRRSQGAGTSDAIEPIMGSGLVTLERVQVIRYGAPAKG